MIQNHIQGWLKNFIAAQGAVAGTVHWHVLSPEKTGLELVAAVNIPPKVQEIVAWVPPGKGMAGQALTQGAPVQTCNLKDDASGTVRPGAKAVDAAAAVALPVRDASGEISAIVGIAYSDQRQFSDEDLARLEQSASDVLLAQQES
ncbi:MAG TPA: GAF domain-containing protein [Candidatus Angelobacter sp.]|nr:GAF domain-containing protein [Candidatus Angelobacter sp.]